MELFGLEQWTVGELTFLVLLIGWLILEVLFYYLVSGPWSKAMDTLSRTPQYTLHPERLVEKALSTVDQIPGYGVRTFLQGWFHGAKLEDIHEENLVEFLAWAMFNKHREDLTIEEQKSTNHVLGELHTRYHLQFPQGFNPAVSTIKFTLDPASHHVIHRPLLFYVFTQTAKIVFHCLLFQAGFMPYQEGPVSYWYRPSARPAGSLEPLPFVFFHGICPGLFVYFPMLKHLCQGRAALLVEMPHIGMGLHLKPPSREETTASVQRAMRRHRISRASVCGHSFGTICAAWMVQECPSVVAQLVLLDPVCLLLSLPNVASNFLYRKPSTIAQHILRMGGASEVGVANTLRRHFWWFNNCLWAEDIANIPTVVHLAANDDVAPAPLIRDYLHNTLRKDTSNKAPTNLEIVWSEGYRHGQILMCRKTQEEFARRMFLQECRLFAEDESPKSSPRSVTDEDLPEVRCC